MLLFLSCFICLTHRRCSVRREWCHFLWGATNRYPITQRSGWPPSFPEFFFLSWSTPHHLQPSHGDASCFYSALVEPEAWGSYSYQSALTESFDGEVRWRWRDGGWIQNHLSLYSSQRHLWKYQWMLRAEFCPLPLIYIFWGQSFGFFWCFSDRIHLLCCSCCRPALSPEDKLHCTAAQTPSDWPKEESSAWDDTCWRSPELNLKTCQVVSHISLISDRASKGTM